MKISSKSSWVIIGSLSLWLGIENPICYIPGLIFLYPLSLVILAHSSSRKSDALRYGWAVGLIGSSLSIYWLAIPMHFVGGLPWILAFSSAVFMGFLMGFFLGLFSLSAFLFHHISFWQKSVMLGLVWYLMEWLRSWVLTGFPWLPFTMGFARYPVMLQFASIIGTYALSGLYVGIVCLVFYSSLHWLCWNNLNNINRLNVIGALALACILFTSIIFFGYIRLKNDCYNIADQNGIVIAIIQGNDDQFVKWTPQTKYQSVWRYIKASEELLKNIQKYMLTRPPDVFLWPETVIPFDFKNELERIGRESIIEFTNKYQTSIIFGAVGIESKAKDLAIFNRVYYYKPKSLVQTKLDSLEIIQWYDKEHLVPFGEYTPPFFNFSFLKQLLQGIGTYTPGEKVAPLLFELEEKIENKGLVYARNVPMGILICYEVIFPGLVRKRVAEGAEVFITVSNDSWFGHSVAAKQHLQLAQMRSIEFGRWMARAAVTGISAFIDPYGRVVDSTKIFIPAYLIGTIEPTKDKTVFFWLEPWLPTFAILILCIMLWGTKLITHCWIYKSRGCL